MGNAKVQESLPLLLEGELPTIHLLSSNKRTFANLILCTIGTGVLGLPYTFSCVGWLLGLFLLAISAVIAYYGMMRVVNSKRRFQQTHAHLFIASYGDLLFHTFGTAGRLTVDILLALSTFSCLVSYFNFISQNLASIAAAIEDDGVSAPVGPWNRGPGSSLAATAAAGGYGVSTGVGSWSPAQATLVEVNRAERSNFLGGLSWTSQTIYVCVLFPFEVALAAIPSVTQLAPMSTVADVISICALGAVMVSEVLAIRDAGFQPAKAIGELLAVPSAFGVGIFAFQSAGMMIPLETAMQEPSKMGQLLGFAFVLTGVLYAIFGALGFVAYGDETQQIITLNLQDGAEAFLIKGAICFSLFLAFPLILNPACEIIERRFSSRKRSLSLRASLVAVICLLAATVKHFTDFLSLAGSSISCLLGFIIPAAVHLKVIKLESEKYPEMQGRTSRWEVAANYSLIAFGLVFGVIGTTISFLNLL